MKPPVENVDVIAVFAVVTVGWLGSPHILTNILWTVVPILVHYPKPLPCHLPFFCVSTIQWPVWDLGCSVPHSSVFKAFDMLFSIRSTPGSGVSPRVHMHFMGSFSQAVPSIQSLQHYSTLWGPSFWSSV